MQRSMLLVCHAADGRIATGNREAVRRVLARADYDVRAVRRGWFAITCADGGSVELVAPGLEGTHTFRRAELIFNAASWTEGVLQLVMSIMRAGGFGLLDGLNATRVMITTPEHLLHYPWLPEPPLIIRGPRHLATALGHAVTPHLFALASR
ncbi:hypothetical protein [Aggregatilinea lenta]|uniref:hypothetical protein n=1 Tax=Aggregatilinea lenta TaxID=913108 RepID=UPI0013C34F55|nr:hypothetical protein [Aggregatilinea lenta]